MAGMFLAALDQSIVAVALPKITSELGGLDKLSWVVTAYLLTSTAATPLWGKISDLRGRRPIFQAAIVVFLIGSLICGFSPEIADLLTVSGINVMIAGRAVQGLGAGGLMSLALAVIGDVIPLASEASIKDSSLQCSASRRWPVRCWAAGSPTTSAGNGSSSSTFRSALLRWSSPHLHSSCITYAAKPRSTTSGRRPSLVR